MNLAHLRQHGDTFGHRQRTLALIKGEHLFRTKFLGGCNMKDVQGSKSLLDRVVLTQAGGSREKLMFGRAAARKHALQHRPPDAFQRQAALRGPYASARGQSADCVLGFKQPQSAHREHRTTLGPPPLPSSIPMIIAPHKQGDDEAGIRINHASPRRSRKSSDTAPTFFVRVGSAEGPNSAESRSKAVRDRLWEAVRLFAALGMAGSIFMSPPYPTRPISSTPDLETGNASVLP
jgi:hypothetical protein